jgi:hypothetical protein
MAYPISDVPRRIVYSGSAGVGPYAFTFEVLVATDIAVYKNATLLTLTTDYTVSINTGTGTGTVTLVVAATGSDQITIVGDRAIQRTSDFVTGGDLFANTLNDELDAQTIYVQQVDEKTDRCIRAPVTDPLSVNMQLPSKANRATKYLGFDINGSVIAVDGTSTPLTVGSIATQDANNVAITGGSISGIADLAVADGGTGSSSAAGARTNLGLVIGTDVLAPNGNGASLTSLNGSQVTTGTVPAARLPLASDADVKTGTSASVVVTPDALRKGALVLDTVQASTSGTAINFTGIPSWVKRITVMFAGVSTSGSNFIDIQIGDSGGIETTGYTGAQTNIIGGSTGGGNYSGDAFELRYNGTVYTFSGHFVLTLLNSATNLWVGSGVHGISSGLAAMFFSAGQKTLSATLDRLSISAGGDTFDAGSINIMYE